MLQIYIMYVKMMLHRKRFYLWYLIFPIAFACLLYIVTTSLSEAERLDRIPVGVVNDARQAQYEAFLTQMSDVRNVEGEPIYQLLECSREEAATLLSKGEIDAYVLVGMDLTVYVKQNGLSQSMVKSFVDQYEQFLRIRREAIKQGMEEIPSDYLSTITYLEEESEDTNITENSMLYFYTLIGMCCFLTLTFGMFLADTILSNQSRLAARMNCTPVGIYQRFLCGVGAAVTVSLFGLILNMCFIRYILGFPLVFEMNRVWILLIIGILVGILFGYVLGSLFRGHKAWKETIAMAMILFFSFFAGIVRSDVKYYIEQNVGWFHYVNPVNLVSDGLYSLLYQGNVVLYLVDLVILCIVGILLFVAALVQTGRRTYEHI